MSTHVAQVLRMHCDTPIEVAELRRIAMSLGLSLRRGRNEEHRDVYLDDKDHGLARRGRRLRLRTDGSAATLCLLTDGHSTNGSTKPEAVDAPVENGVPRRVSELPKPIRERIEALSPMRSLTMSVRLDSSRERLLAGRGSKLVQLAIDEVVAHAADGRELGTFHELTVEIGAQSDDARWLHFAEVLRTLTGLREVGTDSVARALTLAGTPPEPFAPTAICGSQSVKLAARRALECEFRAAQEAELLVRTAGGARAVHRLRVACRRGLAIAQAFGEWIQNPLASALTGYWRRTARALGTVRDLDVLLADLRSDRKLLSQTMRRHAKSVFVRLAARRQAQLEEAVELLRGDGRRATVRKIERFFAEPSDDAGTTLLEVAPRCVLGMADRVLALTAVEGSAFDAEAIHELRLALKHLRYLAEILVPVYGKELRRFSERLARLQELTGRHHDATEACRRFVRFGKRRHGLRRGEVFALGGLATLAIQRADAAQLEIETVRHELSATDLRVLLDAILRSPAPD